MCGERQVVVDLVFILRSDESPCLAIVNMKKYPGYIHDKRPKVLLNDAWPGDDPTKGGRE